PDAAVDLPRAAELRRRLARLPGLQEFADKRRGIDRGIGGLDRLDDGEAEPVRGTGLAQHLGRAAAAVAEGAVVPDHEVADADAVDEQVVDKRFGAFVGELAVKFLHIERVDAEGGDLALLDPERGQAERLAARHEDRPRVRLEGQDRGRDAGVPRQVLRVADHRLMTLVEPVEIAQRQHRVRARSGSGAGMSDDAEHGRENSRYRPRMIGCRRHFRGQNRSPGLDEAAPLREAWYYAAPSRSVRRGRLFARVILGEPVVLGRAADGTPFALR